MIQKYKEENVMKILLVNERIFIQSSHKNDKIKGVYVSDDYYLFTNLQTVYRYRQSTLEVYIENYEDFVVINTDCNDLRQNLSDENKILLFYLSSDDIAIYDLNSRKTIETISFDKDISVYVENGVVVTEGKSYTVKNIISYWTLKNIDVPLWKHTLPEGFKIFGSVQAIDDVLFFSCTDANLPNSKLVGLEIETGKVLWEFENVIDFQIDHKNKLLRGYQGAYYQVIDPFEGKLLINKDLKELWDKGIDPDAVRNTIIDDKLWFVSGRGENAKFGAINLETSEIDFIQDFPLENDGQLDKPVYHKGKLYLLDSNNVLHILE